MSATSSENEAVDTVKDLLESQDSSVWTNADPTILYNWERAFAEKGPADDQPAELYVWQPVDTAIEKLTADGRYLDEDHTVEVQIWTLDDTTTDQYMRDVIQIFSRYTDNQQDITNFVTLPPTAARDLRSDAVARHTTHYLATVEISPQKLKQTDAEDTGFDIAFDSGFA